MRKGKIIQEGSPSQLRKMLEGRIVKLTGNPLELLMRLARSDAAVQDVQRFGDGLHLRVESGSVSAVLERLPEKIRQGGGMMNQMVNIPPTLEDVFIELTEQTDSELLFESRKLDSHK
jgi:ABC-type multidrug transport system ATPase subunit